MLQECRNIGEQIDRLEQGVLQGTSQIYASILRECTARRDIFNGNRIHKHMIASGYNRHLFLGNLLIQMYSKCGNLHLAEEIFHSLPSKNEFSCSILISAYVQSSLPAKAIEFLKQMPALGIRPDGFIFSSILNACSMVGDLLSGKSVHEQISSTEFVSDPVVGTALIDFYVKCGEVKDARLVFDNMMNKDAFSWTAMVSGYTQNGYPSEAIGLFHRMDLEGIRQDSFVFSSALGACSGLKNLSLGRSIQRRVQSLGLDDSVLQNSIINMYGKCGSVQEAVSVFENSDKGNVHCWTSMLAAYAQHGYNTKAAMVIYNRMFLEGIHPVEATYVSALSACTTLSQGISVHTQILEAGIHSEDVQTSLVSMYSKFGCIDVATEMFECMLTPNIVSWTSLIAANTETGRKSRAVELYRQMKTTTCVKPNSVTFMAALAACSVIEEAQEIERDISTSTYKHEFIVGTALVNTYARLGSLQDAERVFNLWETKDTVMYNTMLGAYTRLGDTDSAVSVYRNMALEGILPDGFTFSSILGACSSSCNLKLGKEIHTRTVESGCHLNVVVQNALVSMYAQCASLQDARAVFEEMSEHRDQVSWSSMIRGYARGGYPLEAVELYKRMDIHPNISTLVSFLEVCSDIHEIQTVRERFSKTGLKSEVLDTTLVNVYAKHGYMDCAKSLFEDSLQKDSVSWNAMIAAYAQHGQLTEVLQLYLVMNLEGFEANDVTFVSLFIAFSRAGLLQKSMEFFAQMVLDHSVLPIVEHYICVIDLLGRLGRLDEAEELLEVMPIEPDSRAWRALLAGCKLQKDASRALRIESKSSMSSQDAPGLVLLSNIYSDAQGAEQAGE